MSSPPYDDKSSDDDSQDRKMPAKPDTPGVPDGFPPSLAEQQPLSSLARSIEASLVENPQLAQQLLALVSPTTGPSQDDATMQFLSQLQQQQQQQPAPPHLFVTTDHPRDQNGPTDSYASDASSTASGAGHSTARVTRNQVDTDLSAAPSKIPDEGPVHRTRGATERLLMEQKNYAAAAACSPAAGKNPNAHTTVAFSSASCKQTPPAAPGVQANAAPTPGWDNASNATPFSARNPRQASGSTHFNFPAATGERTASPPNTNGTTRHHHHDSTRASATTGGTSLLLQMARTWATSKSLEEIQLEAIASVTAITQIATNPNDLTPLKALIAQRPRQNLVFATFQMGPDPLVILHSVGIISLNDIHRNDPAIWKWHNRWAGFIGSRRTRTSPTSGTVICTEPPGFALKLSNLLAPFPCQETSRKRLEAALDSAADDAAPILLLETKGGARVTCPNLMPIPWTWAAWMLEERPTPVQAAAWVCAQLDHWKSPTAKRTAATLASFFKCGAGYNRQPSDNHSSYSQLAIDLSRGGLPASTCDPVADWITAHLDIMLPPLPSTPTLPATHPPHQRQPRRTPQAQPAPAPGAPPTHQQTAPPNIFQVLNSLQQQTPTPPSATATHHLTQHQQHNDSFQAFALALANHYQGLEDREARMFAHQEQLATSKKDSKEIPTCILHNLLKFAGLTTDTAEKFPTILADMHRQPSKEAKQAFLNSFIDGLAKKEPGFIGFRNRQLLDDIISFRLAPGNTDDTLHHGLSPLAFISRTPIAIQELDDAQDCYDRATNITPSDLAAQKAATKTPPIPTNFGDAMIPIRMQHTFIRKLFGPWCDAGVAIHTYEHHAAQIRHQVVGQDDILRFFLPQTYHYIIKDTRFFFTQTATAHDVTSLAPDEPLPNPNRAISKLEIATSQLLMLQDLRPLDMPTTLLAPFVKKRTSPRNVTDFPNNSSSITKHPRLTGTGLFNLPPPADNNQVKTQDHGQGTGSPGGGTPAGAASPGERIINNDQPPAFKTDPDLKRLFAHTPLLRLNDICRAAGHPKGWTDIAKHAGIPRNLCASFGVKGSCSTRCVIGSNGHAPASQWNTAACDKALTLMRPGITALLAKAHHPQQQN